MTVRGSACSCEQNPAPSCPLARGTAGSDPRERRNPCGCTGENFSCSGVKTPTAEDFDCEGLAIALVPYEEWGDLNSPEDALCRGSLFQRLDMPFYGQRRRKNKC